MILPPREAAAGKRRQVQLADIDLHDLLSVGKV